MVGIGAEGEIEADAFAAVAGAEGAGDFDGIEFLAVHLDDERVEALRRNGAFDVETRGVGAAGVDADVELVVEIARRLAEDAGAGDFDVVAEENQIGALGGEGRADLVADEAVDGVERRGEGTCGGDRSEGKHGPHEGAEKPSEFGAGAPQRCPEVHRGRQDRGARRGGAGSVHGGGGSGEASWKRRGGGGIRAAAHAGPRPVRRTSRKGRATGNAGERRGAPRGSKPSVREWRRGLMQIVAENSARTHGRGLPLA